MSRLKKVVHNLAAEGGTGAIQGTPSHRVKWLLKMGIIECQLVGNTQRKIIFK